MIYSPSINAIGTMRVFTAGPRLLVEVDIIMSTNETLSAARGVAEGLQIKFESLPDIGAGICSCRFGNNTKSRTLPEKDCNRNFLGF